MSVHHHNPSLDSLPPTLRFTPAPTPPDQAARDRFTKRRAAGRIAELLAQALGRSSAEAGTARLAVTLAAEAGIPRLKTHHSVVDGDSRLPRTCPPVVIAARGLHLSAGGPPSRHPVVNEPSV